MRVTYRAHVGAPEWPSATKMSPFGAMTTSDGSLKMIGAAAGDARLAERHQHLAVRAELDDLLALCRPCCLRVGHPDVAVAVDVQAVRKHEQPCADALHGLAGREIEPVEWAQSESSQLFAPQRSIAQIPPRARSRCLRTSPTDDRPRSFPNAGSALRTDRADSSEALPRTARARATRAGQRRRATRRRERSWLPRSRSASCARV